MRAYKASAFPATKESQTPPFLPIRVGALQDGQNHGRYERDTSKHQEARGELHDSGHFSPALTHPDCATLCHLQAMIFSSFPTSIR